MTDQQLIDALVKRVQEMTSASMTRARRMPNVGVESLAQLVTENFHAAIDLHDTFAHLAGMLDHPTPERRAAALAALDLPQEPS